MLQPDESWMNSARIYAGCKKQNLTAVTFRGYFRSIRLLRQRYPRDYLDAAIPGRYDAPTIAFGSPSLSLISLTSPSPPHGSEERKWSQAKDQVCGVTAPRTPWGNYDLLTVTQKSVSCCLCGNLRAGCVVRSRFSPANQLLQFQHPRDGQSPAVLL